MNPFSIATAALAVGILAIITALCAATGPGDWALAAQACQAYLASAPLAMAVPTKLLLSVAEAAKLVGVSERTIHFWRANGQLDDVFVSAGPGGRVKAHRDRLVAAVAAFKPAPRAQEPERLLRARIETMKAAGKAPANTASTTPA